MNNQLVTVSIIHWCHWCHLCHWLATPGVKVSFHWATSGQWIVNSSKANLILSISGDCPKMTTNNNKIVTLGSLLAQDLPQAYILPERPSTFNHKASFVNDIKYVIHDYSSNMSADHRHLKAMRACPVAGNELPMLLTRDVNPLIKEVG